MNREESVLSMQETMGKFISLVSYQLPDDVTRKLSHLKSQETFPLAKVIYETMEKNQTLASARKHPSCQDTGLIQFFVSCGEHFPLIGQIEKVLKKAVIQATKDTPLRHNAVETFDEYNTGLNVGEGAPSIFWEIKEDSDKCEIYTYMAGGGCTLPGQATVLMPGEGYEGIVRFVLDRITSYGVNACPPLLVGIGVATSVETAAILSKKALMRSVDSQNPNKRAAKLEQLLEVGINELGIGPQGLSGRKTVMGVNIENTARHPSTIGVALNTGCWSHRRGKIVFDKWLNYTTPSHTGAVL